MAVGIKTANSMNIIYLDNQEEFANSFKSIF